MGVGDKGVSPLRYGAASAARPGGCHTYLVLCFLRTPRVQLGYVFDYPHDISGSGMIPIGQLSWAPVLQLLARVSTCAVRTQRRPFWESRVLREFKIWMFGMCNFAFAARCRDFSFFFFLKPKPPVKD